MVLEADPDPPSPLLLDVVVGGVVSLPPPQAGAERTRIAVKTHAPFARW